MASPNLTVTQEPFGSGSVVYGPLAAGTASGDQSAQLSLVLRIVNNEATSLVENTVALSFVAPPVVSPVTIPVRAAHWRLTAPDGQVYRLCSLACLVTLACEPGPLWGLAPATMRTTCPSYEVEEAEAPKLVEVIRNCLQAGMAEVLTKVVVHVDVKTGPIWTTEAPTRLTVNGGLE